MIFPQWGRRERGASVLAALVIAAVLASAGIALQETSPMALLKSASQSAAAAPATAEPSSTDTETSCVRGYSYVVTQQGSEPVTQCVHEMDCGPETPSVTKTGKTGDAKAATSGTTCEIIGGAAAPGDGARCSSWKCTTKYCVKEALTKKWICTDVAGGDARPGDKLSAKQAQKETATDLLGKIAGGLDPTKELMALNMLKQDRALNDAFEEAFGEAEREINEDVEGVQETAEAALSRLGACESEGCTPEQKAAYEKELADAQKQLQDTTDAYGRLQNARYTLKPDPSTKEDPGTKTPPGCTGPTCSPAPPGGDPYRGGPGDTFGQGGSGMRPPGGMGGQQQGQGGRQQQQCQPQYFCNGNAVMYAPCYNMQQGNAQAVQQCPTGYACQQNACKPSAQYGYCADGRTPRTAPEQPKPPASSCTVGLWKDASNGCKTSWRCVADDDDTTPGKPTAQLSCQPAKVLNGANVNISFACANGATDATAEGFTIPSGTLSGTVSTQAVKPAGTQSVTYRLICKNDDVRPAKTASDQCTVEVGNATIVMVATPHEIPRTETDPAKRKSTIGWVTTGMQSCRVSNPEFASWSAEQESNTSISGAAISPEITADTTFLLSCQSLGGFNATSSVTVHVI